MQPHDLTITRASIDQAHDLAQLSSRLFPLACPATTSARDLREYVSFELSPERFAVYLNSPSTDVFLLHFLGKPMGYALLIDCMTPPRVHPNLFRELRHFYIDPSLHGRGFADLLMHAVLEARDYRNQSAPVWLSVHSGNARALAFYKRWGFRLIGSQPFMVGADRQSDLILAYDVLIPTT